jgi:hypothetical protein
MASRKRGSRVRKPRNDPGQLNLFEASEQGARAKPAAPLRVKAKRIKAASIECPVILSPQEAATYLGVAVSTLKSWRAKKIGPPWARRGGRLVCYFPADLDAFLRRGARDPDKL